MKRLQILVMLIAILTVPACAKTTSDKPTQQKTQTSTASGSTQVLMLGRSVLGGWFTHWTGDTSSPYEKDGFTFYYLEIDTPDTIMESVERQIDANKDKGDIVYFKLCFADFEGGDRGSARNNLNRNKKYVEEAYRIIVEQNNKKLIVGNALPYVKEYTDSDLVWNHREYNNWLNDFAASHPGEIWVFDQYGVLADAAGNLKDNYEISADDSHPNDTAYSALDEPLFNLLKSIP